MAENSKIEWTDATWNPVRGCDPVSPGCANCYAAEVAARFSGLGQPYEGLATRHPGQPAKWTGNMRLVPEKLTEPLSWKKPRRVFVNSMSDLFHPAVPFCFIDQVFAVMALARRHTFQILTKRAKRMQRYFEDRSWNDVIVNVVREYDSMPLLQPAGWLNTFQSLYRITEAESLAGHEWACRLPQAWPLPNVWLGVSVENQAAADERVPHLLKCPAAVRFLSCEPLLGPVDLLRVDAHGFGGPTGHKVDCIRKGYWSNGPMGFVNHSDMHDTFGPLHWVIVGGESGPKARPCKLDWIRSIVEQCQAASVPCFVKQLGSNPLATASITTPNLSGGDGRNRIEWATKDRKGGDPAEWPEDLRVRQWPNPEAIA